MHQIRIGKQEKSKKKRERKKENEDFHKHQTFCSKIIYETGLTMLSCDSDNECRKLTL